MGAELLAESEGGARSRFRVSLGRAFVLGRGKEADWPFPEEPFLSRRHAEARLSEGRLVVRRLPEAANPVFFAGEARDELSLASGEFFVIGKTRFRLVIRQESETPAALDLPPEGQGSLEALELYSLAPGERLRLDDLLELPEILRAGKDPASLYVHVAGLLRMSTGARWACVLDAEGRVLARDAADDLSEVRISRSLAVKAAALAPQPVYYRWAGGAVEASAGSGVTAIEGVDWAVGAAARIADGSTLCFYAAGGGADERGLRDKARFAGLVADMVGRALSVDRLQAWERRLERFFSGPVVSKILASQDLKGLAPRRSEATVMFFDLRGFSKKIEQRGEAMAAMLGELRGLMTAMTRHILDEQGVVLEYIGDAIRACWNVPFEDPLHVDRACRAALGMARSLGALPGEWRCGIGIQTGPVVAGAGGSEQIFSYTVLGAVVNQASRIEGITKVVGTPILVSGEVAARLSKDFPGPRRVGRFRPAGMDAALDLFALEEPPGGPERRKPFEEALAAFERGDWNAACAGLGPLAPGDGPARFLLDLAERHRGSPPARWEGVIELAHK